LRDSREGPYRTSEQQDRNELAHGDVPLRLIHGWLIGRIPRLILGRPVEKKPEQRARTPHSAHTGK
jgi:hypothetical protein